MAHFSTFADDLTRDLVPPNFLQVLRDSALAFDYLIPGDKASRHPHFSLRPLLNRKHAKADATIAGRDTTTFAHTPASDGLP